MARRSSRVNSELSFCGFTMAATITLVEQARGRLDDLEVAVVEGIEAPRIQDAYHRMSPRTGLGELGWLGSTGVVPAERRRPPRRRFAVRVSPRYRRSACSGHHRTAPAARSAGRTRPRRTVGVDGARAAPASRRRRTAGRARHRSTAAGLVAAGRPRARRRRRPRRRSANPVRGQVGPDRGERPARRPRRTCSGSAPRDSASMPSAPEPANRSSTVAPVDRAEAVQRVEERLRGRGRWSAGCPRRRRHEPPSPRASRPRPARGRP